MVDNESEDELKIGNQCKERNEDTVSIKKDLARISEALKNHKEHIEALEEKLKLVEK